MAFIKNTLSGDEANDEDIVSFIKLGGEKMINGLQNENETR